MNKIKLKDQKGKEKHDAERRSAHGSRFIEYLILFSVISLFISFFVDGEISLFVSLIKNPFLDWFFQWFSHVETLFVIIFLMTSLFLYDEKKQKMILPLWISFFIALLFSMIIKFVVRRPRPAIIPLLPFLNIIDYSFPSTHSALAFCAVPLLHKEFPRLTWFFVIFASLIGFSRIYLNFHYLSDVIAGASLGLLIGWLIIKWKK